MDREDLPMPEEGILLTQFLVVEEIARSLRFYSHVLGGEVVFEGPPGIVKLANAWLILNTGGGPTEDKPQVELATPADPNRVDSFLNIRVAEMAATRAEWESRGAEFLTEPVDFGHEIRCYLRDPDGHLIEVGEATGMLEMLG
jgi:catechol 2,3-dioxygenase-like lactoylglutathione lyase family enzyme